MILGPAVNREALILNNIVSTLSQIKVLGQPNVPLVLNHAAICNDDLPDLTDDELENLSDSDLENLAESQQIGCTVSFYVDEAKSIPLFSDDIISNPGRFIISRNKTTYTPDDDDLNNDPDNILSSTYAQPIYYVTATFCDGTTINTQYRNAANLIFSSVIVATKGSPKFSTNDNTCIVVPCPSKMKNIAWSDDLNFIILDYDLYLQLNVFDWSKLSEQNRVNELTNANNLIRLALYQDRTRDDNSTQLNPDVFGTNVLDIKPIPSEAVMQGMAKVQCCYQASTASY